MSSENASVTRSTPPIPSPLEECSDEAISMEESHLLNYASIQPCTSDAELFEAPVSSNSQTDVSEDGYKTSSLSDVSDITSDVEEAPTPRVLRKPHSYLSLKDEDENDCLMSEPPKYNVIYSNDNVECVEYFC
jgi:hypothetical protein